MAEVVYVGFVQKGIAVATRQGYPLSVKPSLKLWNHSPTGFEWGYGGSGPAQLALALLLDATGEKDLSVRLHQRYKAEVVCKWKRGSSWKTTRTEILAWVGQASAAPPVSGPELVATPIAGNSTIATNPEGGHAGVLSLSESPPAATPTKKKGEK